MKPAFGAIITWCSACAVAPNAVRVTTDESPNLTAAAEPQLEYTCSGGRW
jgi:hypothetical protein